MRIPILTYHASHIEGNTYAQNDVRALEADLPRITDAGFTVWPLQRIVAAWSENPAQLEGQRIVALTCDDGTDHDYRDIAHPSHGPQRSVYRVLADFKARHAKEQPFLNITSFVVVSPAARAELDRACLSGKGWYNDDWWADAAASGLMDVANHSWDHNHEALPAGMALDVPRGTFRSIRTEAHADHEIRQAAGHLSSTAPNRGAALFAYPYGDADPYLVTDYFPRNAGELGIVAAFTTDRGFLGKKSNRWAMPRFVFRRDWTSPRELDRILRRAQWRWW